MPRDAAPSRQPPVAESNAHASLARVRVLSDLLDNALRIPGTEIRVGLDPMIGLIPGFGDLAGGIASAYIMLEAARAGASSSLLLRMLGNVAMDSLLGAIPVAGDLFDFAWKSNARNVRLLERHVAAPLETRRASTTLVVVSIAAALLVVVGSVVGIVWLIGRLRGG